MSRILIIGGGVAGMSSAIFLAASGLDVMVVERREKSNDAITLKVGESLPPDAQTLLKQLGIWSEFKAGPHLPCYGNKSYWGSDRPVLHDFINHPLGHGWHIDRDSFERLLSKRASSLGVVLIHGVTIEGVSYSERRWRVGLASGSERHEEEFDFIIDASGRNSWFAKSQGVGRLVEGGQLALVSFLKSDDLMEDSMSLIESTDDGWWYSAAIPGHRMATVFICQPDKAQLLEWRDPKGWWELMSRTKHTASRIHEGSFELGAVPKFVSADSGILESLVGEAWLAVGDAAMTYDPIAAHGITMAMVGARDAAAVVPQYLKGDLDVLSAYNDRMWVAYQKYVLERQKLYAQL